MKNEGPDGPDIPLVNVAHELAGRARQLGTDLWTYFGNDGWQATLYTLADTLEQHAKTWDELQRNSEHS